MHWKKRSFATPPLMPCWCGATACTCGVPIGFAQRRTPNVMTISSRQRSRCAGWESPPPAEEGDEMRAYSLNNPDQALAPTDLAGHGVLTWKTSALESDRTAIVETIKAKHGYVDHDVVELSPSTPNLE